MPIPQNFERAQLVIDGGDPIQCAFNPQEYSITKTNVWTIKPVTGTDTPKPEFGGGMPWTIRVQLLLDASLLGADASIKDDAIKLLKMMESGGGGGGGSGPPFVTFKWGSIESPKMVGSSLSIRFVMFRPNGEPARALVDLELTQSEQAHRRARTRPRARSPASRSTPSPTATRCSRSPTRTTATPRAGARSPRPTGSTTRSRSAAAPSSRSRRSRPDAEHGLQRPSPSTDRDRRRRARPDSEADAVHEIKITDWLRLPDVCTVAVGYQADERGRLRSAPRRLRVQGRRRARGQARLDRGDARRRRCSRARSSPSSPTSRPAASRWWCAPTTARTA